MPSRRQIAARIERKRQQHRSTGGDLKALRQMLHQQLRAEVAACAARRKAAALRAVERTTGQLALDLDAPRLVPDAPARKLETSR